MLSNPCRSASSPGRSARTSTSSASRSPTALLYSARFRRCTPDAFPDWGSRRSHDQIPLERRRQTRERRLVGPRSAQRRHRTGANLPCDFSHISACGRGRPGRRPREQHRPFSGGCYDSARSRYQSARRDGRLSAGRRRRSRRAALVRRAEPRSRLRPARDHRAEPLACRPRLTNRPEAARPARKRSAPPTDHASPAPPRCSLWSCPLRAVLPRSRPRPARSYADAGPRICVLAARCRRRLFTHTNAVPPLPRSPCRRESRRQALAKATRLALQAIVSIVLVRVFARFPSAAPACFAHGSRV